MHVLLLLDIDRSTDRLTLVMILTIARITQGNEGETVEATESEERPSEGHSHQT